MESAKPEDVEAFAERLLSILNSGALTLMTSLGHRAGLFDALAASDELRVEELAEAAGLQPRYVREWLGAMVVGQLVEHDPERETYRLPPAHVACLTRAAGGDNMAVFAQYIPALAAVEDELLHCFRHGGGVPYASYPRFHSVMREDSGQSVLPALLDGILPLVDGLKERLRAGIDVLDVGCGSGLALLLLAEHFPQSRFTGVDFSEEAISFARVQATERGLANVRFHQADAAQMPYEAEMDLVTAFDAIHDQAQPRRVLANIRRALRPGGAFLMQDIHASSHVHENLEHPLGPLLYTISCMHCMTVSLAGGGEGLGAMWGDQQVRELLAEAGLEVVHKHLLPHDPQNAYYEVRPAAQRRVA